MGAWPMNVKYKTWKENYGSKGGLLAAMHSEKEPIDGRVFTIPLTNHTQNEVNDFLSKQIGKSWVKASGVDFLIARKKLGLVGSTGGSKAGGSKVEGLLTPLEYANLKAKIVNLEEEIKGHKRTLKKHEDLMAHFEAMFSEQGWTPPKEKS